MVESSMMEVTIRNKLPMAVKLDAFSAKSFKYSMIFADTTSGIKFEVRKPCSASLNSLNKGKAVNKASTTASNGTIAKIVVKVRLEATWVRLRCMRRCTIKPALFLVFNHQVGSATAVCIFINIQLPVIILG